MPQPSEGPAVEGMGDDGAATSGTVEQDVRERLASSGVIAAEEPVVVVSGGSGAHRVRDFLTRNRVPYEVAGGDHAVRCDLVDGPVLEDPSLEQLGEALGLVRPPEREEYDLVVVGAGPAGLAAAVYGASEGLRTVVVERYAIGGQASSTSRIENYLGFPDGVSGSELADRARAQAERLGAEVLLLREVVGGDGGADGQHVLRLSDGTELRSRMQVCATGVQWRELDVDGLDGLLGRGVYYGAGAAEAPGLQGAHVHIVGGGNSAGQAAVFFSDWAERVSLVVRGEGLADSMSAYLLDRITAADDIEVLANTEVAEVHGDDWMDDLVLVDNRDGTTQHVDSHALFVCIGGIPNTEWAEGGVARDERGYLLTGPELPRHGDGPHWSLDRDPLLLETSVPGLFAVGDVRHGATKRVATAAGEGALVIALAHEYLAQA